MNRTQSAQDQHTSKDSVLYMATELSAKNWKLAFGSQTPNPRVVNVSAWDIAGVRREIDKALVKFHMPATTHIVSVQEAGRDGFSVHRFFESLGIESLVVDSSSIEVPRQSRRRKTDRQDAQSLLRMLLRWGGGERSVFRVLRVPSEADEARRRPDREVSRLKKERTGIVNRMRSLLATQGVRWSSRIGPSFPEELSRVRLFDGRELSSDMKEELLRAFDRLTLINSQLSDLVKDRHQKVRSSSTGRRLLELKGIGDATASLLENEFFWRRFTNRREVGAAAGLVAHPYQSGEMDQTRGISKAGNRRVRSLMIELSWGWLRWQPKSSLSRWFESRFGSGSRRTRRTGIVALARKLLIALWRYVERGELPKGAVLMPVCLR